jgi:hypothetical protein
LLRPLIDHQPTADVWYVASQVYEKREHQITCLRRALALDPNHRSSKQRLNQLRREAGETTRKNAPDLDDPQFDLPLPPLSALVDDVIPLPLGTPEPPPTKKWGRKKRTTWTYIGWGASVLLSVSLSYFVLTLLGSPLPAQLRSLFSFSRPSQQTEGTPVFGRVVTGSEDDVPVSSESLSEVESTPEAQGAFIEVEASQSSELQRQKPVSDVLDPGYTHEYTFRASNGEELAIGIQFFSPTAQNVSPNVAVLDPDDVNAAEHCQRDSIMKDNSGVAFICQIHKNGTWKVQLLGRMGESTGVYVITLERF